MKEIEKITSRDNARLAYIKKVRTGKVPEAIFLEGVRLAEEAIRSGVVLKECVVTPEFSASERGTELIQRLSLTTATISEVPANLFKSLADTTNSQGVIIIADRPTPDLATQVQPGDLFIYLHEVNDPSNLGAVARSAEAAGVVGIFLSPRSADPFSPKALRSGMGSNLRIHIWQDAPLAECIEWVKAKGVRVVGADISGHSYHWTIDWTHPTLVVFGSEAHGLDEGELQVMDEVFRIPMKNDVESLNLAVSAGIVLFEAVRQRSNQS